MVLPTLHPCPLEDCQPPTFLQVRHARHAHSYLLVVSPDQAEDKAAVHQGQQVAEEEGQAGALLASAAE